MNVIASAQERVALVRTPVFYAPRVGDEAGWRSMRVQLEVSEFDGDRLPGQPARLVRRYGWRTLAEALALDAGWDLGWKAMRGDGSLTLWSNANSYIGVGDSSTAAASTQTDLQASTNKLRKAQDTGFPKVNGDSGGPAGHRAMLWQSTFATGEANFAWNEIGVFNASSAGTMLDRLVISLGTKTSSFSWTVGLTLTVT